MFGRPFLHEPGVFGGEVFGTPILAEPTPIAFVGTITGAATMSFANLAFAGGDTLLHWVDHTANSVPGSGPTAGWADLFAPVTAGSPSFGAACFTKVAAGGEANPLTVSAARQRLAAYRSVGSVVVSAVASGNGTEASIPAMALDPEDGDAWIVGMLFHREAQSDTDAAFDDHPVLTTKRWENLAQPGMTCWDSGGPASGSLDQLDVTLDGSGRWVGVSVKLIP